jgi:hypothetical protein
MLSCYVVAQTLWVSIAGESPAIINVDNIHSITPTFAYEQSHTTIESGYRSTVAVPISYSDFITQFNTCLTEAQYQE